MHERCPMCFTNLRGALIPDSDPPQYYSHLEGIEIPGIYDGVLFWQCPYCDGRFHQFREGTDLWREAHPYVRRLQVDTRKPNTDKFEPGIYELEDGTILRNVHHPIRCAGTTCSIHRPSQHSMSAYPRTWQYGVVCRICPHGVVHPDPDAMAWRARVSDGPVWGVHECCTAVCCGTTECAQAAIEAH